MASPGSDRPAMREQRRREVNAALASLDAMAHDAPHRGSVRGAVTHAALLLARYSDGDDRAVELARTALIRVKTESEVKAVVRLALELEEAGATIPSRAALEVAGNRALSKAEGELALALKRGAGDA